MLLKYEELNFLLLICAIMMPVAMSSNCRRHFCPHCEEEVWEEVPCDQISRRRSTTTTATESPKLPTYAPTTPMPYTTERPYTRRTPTQAPVTYSRTTVPSAQSTTSSSYQSCYCECKVGCKQFCRKVTVNGTTQNHITQITKTSRRVPNGHLNTEHVHQHIFVPDTYEPPSTKSTDSAGAHPIELPNVLENSYRYPKLAYKVQPSIENQPRPYSQTGHTPFTYEDFKLVNSHSEALLDSSYSVDDLTRLLQMENEKEGSNTLYQPNVHATYGSAPFYPSPPPASSYSDSAPTTKPRNEDNSYRSKVPLLTPGRSASSSAKNVHAAYGSAPFYPSPPPASSYSDSAPTTKPRNEDNSYRSKVPILTPGRSASSSMPLSSSGPQYANYINKGSSSHSHQHESAKPLPPNSNNDQKNAPSLNNHATYYNPNEDYTNSMAYGYYYDIPMSENYVPYEM
ncbi:putative uncharacterized protein DDB_G0291608 [Anastrepha ludens]|uniref:putative uncharacterized protein DDB_G0291608 n=1 Tax=Anastrepha ludens TaxID=28586 RepID=UPI0023AEB435|nr:putative uncharacterized protein DDB_G0291608 [Anastrepha ludens]